LTCLVTPAGARISALYAFAIFGFRIISPHLEWIGQTGAAVAFCCALLFLRNRAAAETCTALSLCRSRGAPKEALRDLDH
jgi:hypothetical protein